MPHQYGLTGFAQSPPSPPLQHNALLPRIGAVPTGSGLITNVNSNSTFRSQEHTPLTREAMERYLNLRERDRDQVDKVIVILHAKVNIFNLIFYFI